MPWLQPTSDCISFRVPSSLPSSHTALFLSQTWQALSCFWSLVLFSLFDHCPNGSSAQVCYLPWPPLEAPRQGSLSHYLDFLQSANYLYYLLSSCLPPFTRLWALFHSLQYLQFLEGAGTWQNFGIQWMNEGPMHTVQYIFLWALYVFYFALKLLCIF